MNNGAETTRTEKIVEIAVRLDLASKRLERLIAAAGEKSILGRGTLLEGFVVDMAGVSHEDHGRD